MWVFVLMINLHSSAVIEIKYLLEVTFFKNSIRNSCWLTLYHEAKVLPLRQKFLALDSNEDSSIILAKRLKTEQNLSP